MSVFDMHACFKLSLLSVDVDACMHM